MRADKRSDLSKGSVPRGRLRKLREGAAIRHNDSDAMGFVAEALHSCSQLAVPSATMITRQGWHPKGIFPRGSLIDTAPHQAEGDSRGRAEEKQHPPAGGPKGKIRDKEITELERRSKLTPKPHAEKLTPEPLRQLRIKQVVLRTQGAIHV